MGWVFLDDRFPEHPKVLAGGPEAAWLYVAGLCYSNRNNTVGHIPRPAVSRLTALRKPEAAAERLVVVRLWHPEDDFEIHDYDDWNEAAMRRSEKARTAARARWSKPPNDAQASAEHVPKHPPEHSVSNANAMPSPKPQFPIAAAAHSGGSPPAETDLAAAALRILAERRLNGTTTAVNNRAAYLANTVAGLRKDHAERLASLPERITSAEQLADWLEPQRRPVVDPTEATAAAQRARAERADQPQCEWCGTRGGGGFIETDGFAEPCPACGTKTAVS